MGEKLSEDSATELCPVTTVTSVQIPGVDVCPVTQEVMQTCASSEKACRAPWNYFAYQPKETLENWLVYLHNEGGHLVKL